MTSNKLAELFARRELLKGLTPSNTWWQNPG